MDYGDRKATIVAAMRATTTDDEEDHRSGDLTNPRQEKLPSLPRETSKTDPRPKRPFEEVAADMFYHAGRHYLIYADRLSGFPIVAEWSDDPTAQQVEYQCQKFFANLGVPIHFQYDNGPQFASKTFKDFLIRWGVQLNTSKPSYPQANYAEVNVQKVKRMLTDLSKPSTMSEEFCEAMMELRNTPNADGCSPNAIVFGRNLRSRVPAQYSSFDKHWQRDADVADMKKAKFKEKAAAHYDSAAYDRRPMKAGTRVRVQDPDDDNDIGNDCKTTDAEEITNDPPICRNSRERKQTIQLTDIGDDCNITDAEEITTNDPIHRNSCKRKQNVQFTVP